MGLCDGLLSFAAEQAQWELKGFEAAHAKKLEERLGAAEAAAH